MNERFTKRKPALATRVSPNIYNSFKLLANNLGITVSEYLRRLILQDLESKKMLQYRLKNADQEDEDNEAIIRRRSDNPAEAIRRLLEDNY